MAQSNASSLCPMLLTLLAGLALAASSYAAERTLYYDEGWLKINQYSPVEGFESHGSYGWHLGIGVIQVNSPANSQRSEVSASDALLTEKTAPAQLPRLFFTRGTGWPVDFGLSVARLNKNEGLQLGAHLQWTIFEEFQKPALAIRIARMQSDGLPGLDRLQTDSATIGLSYGFLRYFNFGFGIGRQQHHLVLKPLDDTNRLGLRAGWGERLERTESIWTLYLKVNLLSPFTSLAIERVYTHPQEAVTIAKLSYML